MPARNPHPWVTITYAMDKLACSHHAIMLMVKHGELTYLNVPRARPKLLKSEVDALAKASLRKAKASREPEGVAS